MSELVLVETKVRGVVPFIGLDSTMNKDFEPRSDGIHGWIVKESTLSYFGFDIDKKSSGDEQQMASDALVALEPLAIVELQPKLM